MAKVRRDLLTVAIVLLWLGAADMAFADGNLNNLNHIVVVMQENHSFDNYLGVLPYAPGSPYHNGNGACASSDHSCIDGLTCRFDNSGNLRCANSNLDDDASTVTAFRNATRCVLPDLDHSWLGVHSEVNFENPNSTLSKPLNDGFVRQNDLTEQIDNGETSTDDSTISYYNQDDLYFYYYLAENFAISDRQYSSLLGPTFPNRSYLMAATSFGHVSADDSIPPIIGYQPIHGTIFDLFDKNGVSWADFYQDLPQSASFRPFDSHNQALSVFYQEAAGNGSLPQVSFVDPNFGTLGIASENDEHPPTDIQRGQYFVSQVVNAVRNGPFWKDTVVFIVYDEHGGFYDHSRAPRAPQNGARTPDGVYPGQCEDLSFPPFSKSPGNGAECSWNFMSQTDTSVKDAEALCPALSKNPKGPYPTSCAAFDQLGARVPLIAVSPFSKPKYVSHSLGDHTSLLALIEKRFLSPGGQVQHMTKRDQYANTLEDLFDFDNSPSLNTVVTQAEPPQVDCTPADTAIQRVRP